MHNYNNNYWKLIILFCMSLNIIANLKFPWYFITLGLFFGGLDSVVLLPNFTQHQGLVVRSLVSANRWLRGIKTYRFPWYLTLVSANHALRNPDQLIVNINYLVNLRLVGVELKTLVVC